MNENFDWPLFINRLWERENAQGLRRVEGKGGYRNGRYYPYKTPNGNVDIGPGFDLAHQSKEFRETAQKQGFTKEELDSIIKQRLKNEGQYFYKRIVKEGGDPNKLTNNVFGGLLDMFWQLGNGLYQNYPNFWKAVAKQDYEGMQRESVVLYKDPDGTYHEDTGRRDFRNRTYFKKA